MKSSGGRGLTDPVMIWQQLCYHTGVMRTQRLFDLLQMLRRYRRPVSAATLAGEMSVSVRTVYRDIAALQAMGAEIEGEPGIGYVLRPGFLLPPLMFSPTELDALTLGLRWAIRRTDPDLSAAARNAMAKLGAVLPVDLRDKMEDEALIVGSGHEMSQSVDLALLRDAIRRERKLAIDYRDEKGRTSSRVVWPVTLAFFETTRLLVAWCELRQDFRHFRADRIVAADLLADRLPRPRRLLVRDWRKSLLTESDRRSGYNTPRPIGRATNAREESMAKDLVFYTNPQSRAVVVHWMLEEVGCPYRIEVLEFGAPMKSPEYLAINPMGKVPAIRHGETVVTETPAICAYLADAFPEAGLAPAPADRGDYYRWLFFTAGCVEPALSNHAAGWDPVTLEDARSFGYGSYQAVIDTLAKALDGRRYIAGDRFSAADVYLGAMVNWGMMTGGIEKRPEFQAYCENLVNRPAALRAREQIGTLISRKAMADA